MTQPALEPVDTLAAEVAAETSGADPEVDLSDAPELLALHRLPFKQRAEFMSTFATISPTIELMREEPLDVTNAPMADVLRRSASLYEALDLVEKLLGAATAEPAAWAQWDGRYDQDKILALFTRYMAEFQPGEASRSSG